MCTHHNIQNQASRLNFSTKVHSLILWHIWFRTFSFWFQLHFSLSLNQQWNTYIYSSLCLSIWSLLLLQTFGCMRHDALKILKYLVPTYFVQWLILSSCELDTRIITTASRSKHIHRIKTDYTYKNWLKISNTHLKGDSLLLEAHHYSHNILPIVKRDLDI